MKMKILPIAVMIAVTVGCCFAASDWDRDADQRKAEYILIEGQTAFSEERLDDYMLLMDKAYALDSNDVDVAGEWALSRLSYSPLTAEQTDALYELALRRFFADPTNYPQAIIMAHAAKQLYKFDDNVRIWETIDSLNTGLSGPSEELARAYLMKYLTGDSTAIDKAMNIYDRLEQGTGRTVNLTAMRFTAQIIKEDTLAAINEIEQLYQSAPRDPQAVLFVGNGYENLGNDSLALQYYSLACELDSTMGQAYMAKANILYHMGDSVGYDQEVFRALHSPNLEVEPKVSILTSYVRELFDDPAQEPRIRELFSDLEQMHTGETSIYDLYGSYLYTIKDYKGAAEQASYTLALNPAEQSNWSTLVQMQALAQDTLGMAQTAIEAKEKFPDDLYFPLMEAESYFWQKDYSRAIATLDSVNLDNKPNPRGVATFLGFKADVLTVSGDTARAIDTYLQAIELEPDNAMMLNNAAYFMSLQERDLDKAEQMSAKSVRMEPDNPTYLDTYAWVFFKKKEYQMAKTYIDACMAQYAMPDTIATVIDETTTDPHFSEETGFVESGHSQTVEELVIESEEAVAEEPSADVFEHAGDIYFMCGEPDQALDFWKKALKLDPDNELLKKKVKHKTFFFK